MSYSGPQWISDYNYKAVLEYRNYLAGRSSGSVYSSMRSSTSAAPRDTLRISGSLLDNTPGIDLIQFRKKSTFRHEPGSYHLKLLNSQGNVIDSASFNPVDDSVDENKRFFDVELPLSESKSAQIVSIEIEYEGRIIYSYSRINQITRSGTASEELPEIKRTDVNRNGPEQVLISWDNVYYKQLIVKNNKGEVQAIDSSGKIAVFTGESELELTYNKDWESTVESVSF